MKIKPLYCCETCGKSYHTVREAEVCENGHRMGNIRCKCGSTLFTLESVDWFWTIRCHRCGRKISKFVEERRVE